MRTAVAAVLSILAFASPASGASILLSFDPDCSTCSIDVQAGQTLTLYVTASEIGGIWEGWGVGGAEFRILGLPPEWMILTRTPSPSSVVVIGDPFGDGTNIALYPGSFGACVNLFTFTILATTPVQDRYLTVAAHATPSNPGYFDCPVLVYSDCGPRPGKTASICAQCVPQSQAILNPSGPACTVPVVSRSWAQIKRLFG